MKHVLTAFAIILLAACSMDGHDTDTRLAAADPAVMTAKGVPAGAYKLDPTHASLTFRVNHLGLSNYTARFTKLDADLQFNPAAPETMSVKATVDPRSLETDFPLKTPNFDAELYGKKFLDAKAFPKITFASTRIELTGERTARVHGDMSLHGVTRPAVMDVTFNGGYPSIPMDPSGASRIGFSAKGALKRSDFGVSYGLPQAGSTLGVGDDVEFTIEAEFTRPGEKKKA